MQQDRASTRQSEDQINIVVDHVHVDSDENDVTKCIDPMLLPACRETREEYIVDAHSTKEVSTHGLWWASVCTFGKKYKSVSLENKGSVARDHLALERTFLAWLRTSLAFASIGIAVTQLFRLNDKRTGSTATDYYESILVFNNATQYIRRLGKSLGTTFIGISIATLLLGSNRYFECQKWVIRGKFPACRGSITLMAVMTFALMITSLFVILLEPSM